MTDTPAPEPDPLEDLLRPPPGSPAGDPLRQALLLQTRRLLGRRRRWKRLAFAAALAACYVAGMLTMRLVQVPGESDKEMVNKSSDLPGKKAPRPSELHQARPSPKKGRPPRVSPAAKESALALEWRAIDNKKNRFQLYRRAGDLYLQDNDVSSALRCYRGALTAAPARERTISVNDNWLLMIAKQERY